MIEIDRIVVGIGYRSTASASDVEVMVRTALNAHGLYGSVYVAAPAFKSEDRDVIEGAARHLKASVEWIGTDALAEVAPRCLSQMSHTMPGVGRASVAEACALAAAGTHGVLLGPRRVSDAVSCAIALRQSAKPQQPDPGDQQSTNRSEDTQQGIASDRRTAEALP
jgi:cobalt-precorrin 5A hydrolase